jgi:thiamine phosphate synthase YjbQ (UPF0047 family)
VRSKVRVISLSDEKSESDVRECVKESITSTGVCDLCSRDTGSSIFVNHNVWPGHKEYWERV